MIRAEARNAGEIRQGRAVVQIVPRYSLARVAAVRVRTHWTASVRISSDRRMPHHPHRERRVQRAYEDMVEKLSRGFVNKGRDNLWASGSSSTLARAPGAIPLFTVAEDCANSLDMPI